MGLAQPLRPRKRNAEAKRQQVLNAAGDKFFCRNAALPGVAGKSVNRRRAILSLALGKHNRF